MFFEHKSLYATKGEVPDGEHVDRARQGDGRARRRGRHDRRARGDGARALEAAERLAAEHGIDAEVIDLRSLVPLDTQRSSPRWRRPAGCSRSRRTRGCCGWGAEIASIVAEEGFWDLDGPIVRITTPHIPLPSAAVLEDLAIPSVDRIVDTVKRRLDDAA